MKLPALYKKTKTGAIQVWVIETRGAEIITTHGQFGGAMQTTSDTVKAARSADSVERQAEAEATSKHLGKKKKGYVEDLAAARAGKVDEVIEGGILPMLAFPYEKVSTYLKFPAYVQPKLDGHRCVAEPKGLWSRTRKPVKSVPHIAVAVAELGIPWLDGELYVHTPDLASLPDPPPESEPEPNSAVPVNSIPFEKLTSLLRKQEPAPGHEIVQFHVYDLPGSGTFAQRWAMLEKLKPRFTGLPLRVVETILVNNEAEMWAAFERFRGQGYEGAIVRNADGLYENARSYGLMKLKKFQDAEFKIMGLEEGRGKLQGHCGSFVCEVSPGGPRFKAKMVGELSKLKTAWENPATWVGKMLTVKYQDLTSAGIPRFPVAMRLRVELDEVTREEDRKVEEIRAAGKKNTGLSWAKVRTK